MSDTDQRMANTVMDAMNFIDDDLILSAEEARSGARKTQRKTRRTMKFAYTAYALAAAILLGFGVSRFRKEPALTPENPAVAEGEVTGEGIEVAYVDVEELLAKTEEATSNEIVTDLDFETVAEYKAGDESTSVLSTLPYDGSKMQVIRLAVAGEDTLYARVPVTDEGQKRLPECAGEAVKDEEGWYLLAGHEDTDYLVFEDANGEWSLWEKR